MRTKILTVTFNPAIDRVIRHDRPHAPVVLSAGGKGINVARAAHALGLRVEAVAVAGGSPGALLQACLRRERLPHELMPIHGITRVNTTEVSEKGRVRRVMEAGPVLRASERGAFAALVLRKARRCAAVVFSGSLPVRYPIAEFIALVRRVQCEGVPVAVDTRGSVLKAVLHLGVDIIKPNREEAEEVLGFKLSSAAARRKALRVLTGYGIKKVLISLGKDGIIASDGPRDVVARTVVVRQGHAVGCGDAALAGFLAAHIRKAGFERCVALAAACGAANVLAGVPGGINKKDVQRFLTRRKVYGPGA